MELEKIQPVFLRNVLNTTFSLTDKIPKFVLRLRLDTSESKPDDGNII